MKFYSLICLSFCLLLMACDSDPGSVVGVPNVNISCSSPECSGSLDGKFVRIIMARTSCKSLDFSPVATGSSNLSCVGSDCSASVTNWLDANGNAVSEVISGSYNLCGLIDSNSDLLENTGDLEHESFLTIQSSATLIVDVWSVI